MIKVSQIHFNFSPAEKRLKLLKKSKKREIEKINQKICA